MQEAFWKAWRQRGRLRAPEAFPAWWMRILANTYRDWWRHERRTRARTGPFPPGELPSAGCAWEPGRAESDQADALRRALLRLAPDDRLALVLRYYHGLSIQQVASVLGRRPNTAVSRIHRALAKIRDHLTQEGSADGSLPDAGH